MYRTECLRSNHILYKDFREERHSRQQQQKKGSSRAQLQQQLNSRRPKPKLYLKSTLSQMTARKKQTTVFSSFYRGPCHSHFPKVSDFFLSSSFFLFVAIIIVVYWTGRANASLGCVPRWYLQSHKSRRTRTNGREIEKRSHLCIVASARSSSSPTTIIIIGVRFFSCILMRANFSNSSVHQLHLRKVCRMYGSMGRRFPVRHVFALGKNSFERGGKEGQNRKENRYAYTAPRTRPHFRFHRQKFIRIHFINMANGKTKEWEWSSRVKKKKKSERKTKYAKWKTLAKRCGEYAERKEIWWASA